MTVALPAVIIALIGFTGGWVAHAMHMARLREQRRYPRHTYPRSVPPTRKRMDRIN